MNMKAYIQHQDKNGNKMVVQALVPFIELKKAAIFTSKINPNSPVIDIERISKESYDYYQRRIDPNRIREIEKFIVNSIIEEQNGLMLATLFPSSMILAVECRENGNQVNIKEDEEGVCSIVLNDNVFIVDGQHRLMAMRRLYENIISNKNYLHEYTECVKEYLEQYKFNCSILVNYDLWEQGQVFINVNFKQKSVNKSLYYEVFGSEYRENKSDWQRNKIYLAHCLAKKLNEHVESPYYQRIKMLGTGKGYISQAFVVEALLPLFKEGEIWEFDEDDPDLSINDYLYFGTELLSYYVAIKRIFPKYWPGEEDDKGTIICKTTGFGAFCQLMRIIRTKNDIKMINELKKSAEKDEVCQAYVKKVEEKFHAIANQADNLFGEGSSYQSMSGKGAETKLRSQLLSILGFDKTILKVGKKWPMGITTPQLVDKIYENLREYIWKEPISDLEEVCNHYEVEDIKDIQIKKLTKTTDTVSLDIEFKIEATLYLDHAGDIKYPISTLSSCTVIYHVEPRGNISAPRFENLRVDTGALNK